MIRQMSMMINFDRKYNIITEQMITFMAFLRLMGIHIVAVVKAIWRSQLMLLCNICIYDGTRSINMALPCLMYRLLPYSQLHFYLIFSVSLRCYILPFYLIIFTIILKNIPTILKKYYCSVLNYEEQGSISGPTLSISEEYIQLRSPSTLTIFPSQLYFCPYPVHIGSINTSFKYKPKVLSGLNLSEILFLFLKSHIPNIHQNAPLPCQCYFICSFVF